MLAGIVRSDERVGSTLRSGAGAGAIEVATHDRHPRAAAHRRRPVGRLGERRRTRVSRSPVVPVGRLGAADRDAAREPHGQEPDSHRLGAGRARCHSRRRDRRGPVDAIPIGADPEREEAHALAAGFDPRTLAEEYVYLRITPHEIQAWREANELAGRHVMRGGAWLERDGL